MKNEELRLVLSKMIRGTIEGDFASITLDPAGDSLSHSRDFEIGDDLRRIQILPTLASNRLTLLERNVDMGANIYFLIDGSLSSNFASSGTSKFNYSVGLANCIARACLGEGNRFNFIIFTEKGERESGFVGTALALEEKIGELYGFEPEYRGTSLKNTLRTFNYDSQQQRFGRPSIVFILSDFLYELDFVQELIELNEGADIVIMLAQDQLELELPRPRFGFVRLYDPEKRQFFLARASEQGLDRLRLALKRYAVDCLPVLTSWPQGKNVENLMKLFEGKEV